MKPITLPHDALSTLLGNSGIPGSGYLRPRGQNARQPVHVFYGGAHLYRADSVSRLGSLALAALDEYAGSAEVFGEVLGIAPALRERIYTLVRKKLQREPVEDQRIDFEDGFGVRSDAEEDDAAEHAATEVAKAKKEKLLPPNVGLRIRPMHGFTIGRSLRTLDIFVTTLCNAVERPFRFPDELIITLPKVTGDYQVRVLARMVQALERCLQLNAGALRMEAMVETPLSIYDEAGRVPLRSWVAAGEGRLDSAHFGTYDYTAACGIAAGRQRMNHPACDLARSVMQAAFAGTEVALSDGGTNVLPVPVHRGETLSDAEREGNRRAVHSAFRLHFDHVSDSLDRGFYRGWDLHPAQLPVRYAATYAFFLAELEPAGARLRNFLAHQAQASRVGTMFDDAATGRALVNFFLRAHATGAIDANEAKELTGESLDKLRERFPSPPTLS